MKSTSTWSRLSTSTTGATPTIHEGYAARAIEERGGISERCEINREIKRENAERQQARQKKRSISPTISTGEGQNLDIESQGAISSRTGGNHQRPTVRDYVAEAEQLKFDATEREIARISAEREAKEREQRLAAERTKRQQQSRKSLKTIGKSNDNTFTR